MSNNNDREETAAQSQADEVAISSRSVDDYYNIAYEQSTRNKWQFYLIYLSLGIANSGDATEISCMNYILSHPLLFKRKRRYDKDKNQGLRATKISNLMITMMQNAE